MNATRPSITPTERERLRSALTIIDAELAANPTNMVAQGDRSYVGDVVAYGAVDRWNAEDALGIAAEYLEVAR
jgi:hypothetical protein